MLCQDSILRLAGSGIRQNSRAKGILANSTTPIPNADKALGIWLLQARTAGALRQIGAGNPATQFRGPKSRIDLDRCSTIRLYSRSFSPSFIARISSLGVRARAAETLLPAKLRSVDYGVRVGNANQIPLTS